VDASDWRKKDEEEEGFKCLSMPMVRVHHLGGEEKSDERLEASGTARNTIVPRILSLVGGPGQVKQARSRGGGTTCDLKKSYTPFFDVLS